MKRFLLTILFAFAATVSLCAQEETMGVAILKPVDEVGDVRPGVKLALRSTLQYAINRMPGYEAYTRVNLSEIMDEHKFQRSGFVSDNEIKEIGKATGAKYILIAEASYFDETHITVTASIIDIETTKLKSSSDPVISPIDAEGMKSSCISIARSLLNMDGVSIGGTGTPRPPNGRNGTVQRGQDFTETAFGINMRMIYVEGGSFTMGCTSEQGGECDNDESPNRQTTVSSYYIGMLEVTQSQWEKVMGRNPLQEEINKEKSELDNMKKEIAKIEERITFMNQVIASARYQIQTTKRKQEIESYAKNIALSSAELEGLVDDLEKEKKKYQDKSNVVYKKESMVDANKPIYYVSWEEAKEFCARLSRQTGKTYRLPTEAEWEYAARGGKKNEGTKYAGGWSIDDVAWYSGNSNSSTHMCGTKRPNALGLYDMSGNVWEWCEDWYGSQYLQHDNNNPKGASSSSYRVFRGGGWGSNAGSCRVSNRSYSTPSSCGSDLGFRVVLVP